MVSKGDYLASEESTEELLPEEPNSPTLQYLDANTPAFNPVQMALDKVHGRWQRGSRSVSIWMDRLMCPKLIPVWMLLAVVVEAAAIYGGMKLGGVVQNSFNA